MADDVAFMRMAIDEARAAAKAGNTPFGSVIVLDERVVGRGQNRINSADDPTAHAETDAIRVACRALQTPYLTGATLYATGEPCAMCATAIRWAGISRVVIGAYASDWAQWAHRWQRPATFPYTQVVGVLRDECAQLYQE